MNCSDKHSKRIKLSSNKFMINRIKTLTNREWLQTLVDPRVTFVVERFGHTRVSREWRLCNRRIPQHYLTFVTAGMNRVKLDDEEASFPPESLLFIRAGYPHSMHPAQPHRGHTFYHLRFELIHKEGTIFIPETPYCFLPDASELRSTITACWQLYNQPLSDAIDHLQFRTGIALILCSLFRTGLTSFDVFHNLNSPRLLSLAQREVIENYFHHHLHAPITPAQLAKAVGLNADYFTRLFRNTYGLPPRLWITRRRLEHAAFLLVETTLRIGEIAERIGYRDIYQFSSMFRKIYGCSPSRYRRKMNSNSPLFPDAP
ncbi:MAG: AraC family transcriptional regulator [Lentisphaerae bacterium]|nr:MAG: AraC family transcriptional regulator [Lentisphaerota bacterium]